MYNHKKLKSIIYIIGKQKDKTRETFKGSFGSPFSEIKYEFYLFKIKG